MIEGKISVENFLNAKIKAGVSGELPVYTRVRFNKKQTEFKSFSFLFDENEEFNDAYSLSNFGKAQRKPQNPFKREGEVLTEIVDLHRRKDVNILDTNPKLIFQKSLMPIHDIISVYAKFKMKELFLGKYQLRSIDWQCFFPILFEDLTRIAGDTQLRKDLKAYEPYYNLIVSLKDYPGLKSYRGFRAYQWEYGGEGKEALITHLKDKKCYDANLLEAIFHFHYSSTLIEFTEDNRR